MAIRQLKNGFKLTGKDANDFMRALSSRPEDKGKLHGTCNRGACDAKPASWWNPHTRAHYCCQCAQKINAALKANQLTLCEQAPTSRDSNNG